MDFPLSSHPIISTSDAEQAQSILSKEMLSLRFRKIRERSRFQFTMNAIHLGKTMIGFNQFHEETEVDAGEVEDAVMFTMCIGAPAVPVYDGEVVGPDLASITSPKKHLTIHREPNSQILILRSDLTNLRVRLQEILGRTLHKPLQFEISTDLKHGAGLSVRNLLRSTIEQCSDRNELLNYPLLKSSLDDMLLNALLSLPHNYHDEIKASFHQSLTPGLVRKAEEYLKAHARTQIHMSEVIAICDCSRSALYSAFQHHRGYTPMQFLANCRLQLAREALLRPSPGASVTTIALACGFPHLGRFSAAYKQRYGESPSETLRK